MAEINLLAKLPRGKRNVSARATAKTEEHIRISREYGELYFDGPREYGYGGYRYDGRWVPVAQDMIEHFDLKPGDRVLDVGCAKGFLVKDFMKALPGPRGLRPRHLALRAHELRAGGGRPAASRHRAPICRSPTAASRPPSRSTPCTTSIATGCITALQELQRVSDGRAFVQVNSYRTPEQKAVFEDWVLTAKFHDYPDGWIKLFKEAGYTGDYYWTIIE